jgi:hypothetical protein
MAITIPNTFVAGTKIEAAPVNSNFAEVANAVDKRGDTLTGNLSANAGVTVDGVDLSTIPNTGGTFNPLFSQVVIGTADTNGIRLDLESGTLAVREGDDSAYAPLISGLLTTSGNHVPATNDGGALGTTSLSWADLFLASGAVINFNNGDVTITHSTNTLTFDGAPLGYVFTASGSSALIQINNTSAGKSALQFRNGATAYGYVGASGSWLGNTDTDLMLAAETGRAIRFYTNGSTTERAQIDSNGNFGIGGAPGSVRLDLIGLVDAVRVSGSTTNSTTKEGKFLTRHYTNSEEDFLLAYAYSTSTDNGIAFGGGSGSQNAATLIGFYTAANNTTVSGTERLRINSSGHVGIGATARLYLDGVAGTGDTYLEEYGANEVRLTVGGSAQSAWNTTGQFIYYNPPTTAAAANAYIAQTDYIRRSTSSIRYKHDIATLDGSDALAAVMAMRPVTYRGKTDEDQRRYVGFVAEEVQEIAPLLCTYDDGGESGTPNYVTYDRVTAYLVAVVQQQQTEINALKARIH